MKTSAVRLQSLHIKNFKNVKNGQVDFHGNRKSSSAILGLYGQNGSGKTALIEALNFFKILASGKKIPEEFCEQINVDASYAQFAFHFQIEEDESNGIYDVYYECKYRKEEKESHLDINEQSALKKRYQVVLYDEILSYSYQGSDQFLRKAKLIDTNTDDVFIPQTKYRQLIGNSKSTRTELLVAKKLAEKRSLSFVFSKDLNEAISNNSESNNSEINKKTNAEAKKILFILSRLFHYALMELFVVTTRESGLISLNALPFLFKQTQDKSNISGAIPLFLNKTNFVDKSVVNVIKRILPNMNIVLNAIIPGLTIELKVFGEQLQENNKEGMLFEMVSNKNQKQIPLRYESEGIKKIIAILHLLVAVYNQKSITVAIDELDSGIFEYLLGELLRIISEKGKGQLIFTSHNLRPLETIDRNCIVFTTTDPSNRYLRLSRVRDANNLRDSYFRYIVLNKEDPLLYQSTSMADISLAFREAGLDK